MRNVFCVTAAFTMVMCFQASSQTEVLYDLDFTEPEVGSYEVLYGFGVPTVVPSFGGMSDALLFHATKEMEAITLPFGTGAISCTLDFDLVTHRLESSFYEFVIFPDTPEPNVHRVYFHGGGQSDRSGPNQPIHV